MLAQRVRGTAIRVAGSGMLAGLALFAGMALSVRSNAAGRVTPASATHTIAGDPLIVQNASALLHDPQTQVLGNPRGDVTIVEFFDYACPFCKAAEPRLEALLKSDRDVRLVVKEFPVLSPQSGVASKVALAAAKQGKYAAFHQALLLHQGRLEDSVIFDVARSVGLDMARLRKDMNDPDISNEIAANLKLARAIHVEGTPTFIVGNRFLTQPSAEINFPAVVASARGKLG